MMPTCRELCLKEKTNKPNAVMEVYMRLPHEPGGGGGPGKLVGVGGS